MALDTDRYGDAAEILDTLVLDEEFAPFLRLFRLTPTSTDILTTADPPWRLSDIASLPYDVFVERLGFLFEGSPWIRRRGVAGPALAEYAAPARDCSGLSTPPEEAGGIDPGASGSGWAGCPGLVRFRGHRRSSRAPRARPRRPVRG